MPECIGVAARLRVGERKLLADDGIIGTALRSFFEEIDRLRRLALIQGELAEGFEGLEILRIDAESGCEFGLCRFLVPFFEQRLGQTAVRAGVIGGPLQYCAE